MRDLWTQWPTD